MTLAYILVGENSAQPAEPTIGDVVMSEEAAEDAIAELDADGPYDVETTPYWEAPEDALFRKWGFEYPRATYRIEPRRLHGEE